MNQNISQALKSQLDRYKQVILTEQKSANQEFFKHLIKNETTKLLKTLPKGVDKNELLNYLQDIFGSQNFQNGKYKGGQEVIIQTIHEFFGKENFKDGKFQGGWNEKQDTTNIRKVFGEKNFTNGEYTGGWNKQQDQQNLKQSLENGEAKNLTSQLIEQKLGGSEKFQEGVYQSKPEIVKSVLEELKAEGAILKEVQNIFGQEKFYPNQGGDGIPQGREGFYKKDEEIALLQAEANAKIKAIESWREFYQDHGITETGDKTFWSNKYGSDVKTAEGVYKDALLKGEEVVGGDFTKLEENRINKAPTPEKIKEILTDIPIIRRKKAWENFFANHDTLGNIKLEWKENWTKSSLSIEVAKLIYNNGWYNSPNGLINNDKIIENYTTDILVMGQKHPQTTKLIETLKHSAEEVDKVHEFIAKRLETETNLDKFPNDEEIKQTYNEKKVPDTRGWGEIGKIRDSKIKTLFKQYFQGEKPTNLKDNEIELWRTSPTGLPNTGKDQRKVFDNGWIKPNEIKEGKTDYEGIVGIEVLKVKKADIDNEIKKVNVLVAKIANFKFLRELDAEQANIDQTFKDLKRDLLPLNKDKEITDIVTKQKDNLWYSLTIKEDGGIDKTELDKILANMKDRTWDATNYEQVNTKVINAFLRADLGIKEMNESLDEQIKEEKDPAKRKILESQKLLQPGRGWEDLDQPNEKLYGTNEEGEPNSWLMSQGGYELPDDIVKFEEKLPTEKRGSSLLKYFYEKSTDRKNRPFDPQKYVHEKDAAQTFFCQAGKKTITWTVMERQGMSLTKKPVVKSKEIDVIGGDKGTQGHLAVAAGGGKTTKTINCMVNGGKEHVILICPTPTLVESAFKHHTSWLQEWGCVFHKKSKRVRVLKGTLKEATQQEIDDGYAEDEPVEIYEGHGDYPVAKNRLVYWEDEQGNRGGDRWQEGKKGLSILYYGDLLGYIARRKMIESGAINEWKPDDTPEWNEKTLEEIVKKIKGKLITKDDSLVTFDEGHYNIGAYQASQLKMVQAEFKEGRMSATFPGVPFSTTSTYPKKSYYSGELDPKMPGFTMKIANEKHAEALAKFRKVDVSTIKWQDENGQYLPVPVSLDERLRFGKTLIFVRDINITAEQSAVFGNKYSCVAFTPIYKDFCETVSFGRQPGAVMIGNFEHQMGLTFEIDTVISTGLIEVSNLGKNFTYSDKMTQFEPISSLIQEQGRVGRIQNGLWITLTKECQEIIIEEDVEAAMVKAVFDGDITPIKEAEYPFFDIKMLWGGLAHPHRFGKPPAEALIGLKVDKNEKERVKNKQPLTKIVWRTKEDKGDLIQKGYFSSVIPDEALWERYLDIPKPEMRADDAKELLKELITNFIAKDKNFPKGLNLKSQSNLIGAVYGKSLEAEKKAGKQEIAEEMKNVLNGAIEKEIKKFIKDKVYDDNNLQSKDPKVIQDIVNLYRLNNTDVYFTFEENEEKKEVWTLNMKHNARA